MPQYFRDVRSSLVRSVAPTVEPLDLFEAKEHLREEGDDEDDLIAGLTKAAREMVEEDAELSLLPQTWKLYLDCFPADWIELRRPPVTAVSSITYVDAAGTTQTLSSSNYTTDLVGFPGRISPAYGVSWPTLRPQANAIVVTFTAGYASAALVPELAKQAMRLLIGHWYENREAVLVGTISKEIELAYEALIRRLKWDM